MQMSSRCIEEFRCCMLLCYVMLCSLVEMPLQTLCSSTEPPANTLITCDHQSTSWRNLSTPSSKTSHERPESFRLDDMHRERNRRGVRVESGRRAVWRGCEDLSTGLEDIERLREHRRDCTGKSAGDEGGGQGRKIGTGFGELRLEDLETGPV